MNARDAVDAGTTLADSFPVKATRREALGQFVQHAVSTLRSQKLNFYKRARFANAFRWRLLEKGVAAETAAEITQELLVISVNKGVPSEEPVQPEAVAAPRRAPNLLAQQAQDAYARGDYSQAIEHYTALVTLRPRDADVRINLGASLVKLGQYEPAQEQFRKAIARQRGCTAAYVNLANLQMMQGQFAEAETALHRALATKPTDLAARIALGTVLSLQGRLKEARTELEKVLRVAPRNAEALCALGSIEMFEGRFAEAEQLLKQALVANPQLSSGWSGLAQVRKMNGTDKLWLKRAQQAADSLTAPTDEAAVRFAIGKYFDDVGEYSKAFTSYSRANELLKTIATPYQRDQRTGFVDDMVRNYTADSLARPTGGTSTADKPILIVGMMRSGTSLVEQILASHPRVGGAGELDFWTNAVHKHDAQVRQGPPGEKLRYKLAEEYMRTLGQRCPQSQRVIDKAPVNADYLGLVHSVLPRARIIHMQRDPRDTCLSCYFQPFSAGLNFTLDLADLAHYYTEHERVMAHWRQVLPPSSLLDVPYEELVANQEYWTRKILDFLELEWDARCLQFQQTQRAVVTASRWQVRQPIYRGSVQRWRNYSQFIGPLRDL
jgi:Flp pilus assembly protein TadD